MDSKRQPKRPRSSTPSKVGDPSPPKKKKKKTKKNKTDKEGSPKTKQKHSKEEPPTSAEATTTSNDRNQKSEDQMMSQMLSTFSKVEQSRFEAFRCARFSPSVIENWVAAVLSDRYRLDECRELNDLVLPNQSADIVMVVSTLAKTYAQRLVWEASKLNKDVNVPLQPHHIRTAWEDRKRRGLDPGLFLQPAARSDTPLESTDNYDMRHMAALAAQEEYDKQFPPSAKTDEAQGDGEVGVLNTESETLTTKSLVEAMQVDSNSTEPSSSNE